MPDAPAFRGILCAFIIPAVLRSEENLALTYCPTLHSVERFPKQGTRRRPAYALFFGVWFVKLSQPRGEGQSTP